jgi:hypothetical protein
MTDGVGDFAERVRRIDDRCDLAGLDEILVPLPNGAASSVTTRTVDPVSSPHVAAFFTGMRPWCDPAFSCSASAPPFVARDCCRLCRTNEFRGGASHTYASSGAREHIDHNGSEALTGKPFVVRGGCFETPVDEKSGLRPYNNTRVGKVMGIPSDHGEGLGPTTIFAFALDRRPRLPLRRFGKPELHSWQEKAIGRLDLLFVPVGGIYTIDGRAAARIAQQLAPKWVIPIALCNVLVRVQRQWFDKRLCRDVFSFDEAAGGCWLQRGPEVLALA